jgi:GNAT superfamily N-acetyltransferase
MDNLLHIRPAAAEDAPEIEYVRLYTWKTTYSGLMPEEMLDQRIADIAKRTEVTRQKIKEGLPYFAAEYQGRIVGMAVCTPSRDPDYPQDGEIQAIYILKAYQGLGIGRALFSFCREYLCSCGHKEMIVNCLEGNPSAAFYEKMGGKAVGKRQDPMGDIVIKETIFRFVTDK